MVKFFRSIVRASSFFRKEIFEILRQPRLVATLILGPFLILLVFGIGYHDEPSSLRTLFVAQSGSLIASQDIEQYGKSLKSLLTYAGITDNQNEALDKLRRGEVDLVIVVPQDALSTIQSDQQAVFTLYHREIDPAQVDYVEYLGWLYAEVAKQQILQSFAVQGQASANNWQASLQEAHQSVSALREAVQSGNDTLAQQKQQELAGKVDALSLAISASAGLLENLQQTGKPNGGSTDSVQGTLTDLHQNTSQLSTTTTDVNARLANIDKIEKDIAGLENQLAEFKSIDPAILVDPFRSETKSIAPIQPSMPDFFAPAVLALLLQHLAVTFAALSIVRERNVGTMELFRVSPISAGETLFGKYISYMLFGGVIAASLSVLLIFALHVPMLGNWWYFALVIAAVLFSSLGIGFIISIISQTDSQAVQYSMITLLASVFFSGFIMSLDRLLPFARVISWMLPTTYGTLLLRDIALRGVDPNWALLGGLTAFGLFLMFISWRLMHRLITSPQ